MISKNNTLQKSPHPNPFDDFLLYDYLCRRMRKAFPKEMG